MRIIELILTIVGFILMLSGAFWIHLGLGLFLVGLIIIMFAREYSKQVDSLKKNTVDMLMDEKALNTIFEMAKSDVSKNK